MIKLIISTVVFFITLSSCSAQNPSVAKDVVITFYNSINMNDCKKAISLRTRYSMQQCNAVNDIKINSLHEEFNDGNKSVFFININYRRNRVASNFTGFLWLKRSAKGWEIQNNYISNKLIDVDAFIKKYIGGIHTEKPQVELLKNDSLNRKNHNKIIRELRKKYKNKTGNPIILIDISEQKLYRYNDKNKLVRQFSISTATKGAGNQRGSDKTPLGAHVVKEKFGHGAKIGAIFKARRNTGLISKIFTSPIDVEDDEVTTRILWLDGLEINKNKGGNVDSHSRYIYIHGTPEEGLIGRPASHGCIRMYNNDVVSIFNKVPVNTIVYIGR